MKRWMMVSALLLTACGTFPTQEGYAQKAYYWQGRDVNQLLAEWGAPQKTLKMPNGNMLYTYSKEFTQREPLRENRVYEPGAKVTYNENGQTKTIETPGRWVNTGMIGGGSTHYSCTTNFVVNPKSQLVETVSFDGNNCVAVPRQ